MIETNLNWLHTVSTPVDLAQENVAMMFNQLENELSKSKVPGIGLAGIQIGISKQVAIIHVPMHDIIKLWNPEIISQEGSIISPEGCLSVPNVSRSVTRVQEITIKNGDGRIYQLYDMEAIVAQHEIEHLRGITIIDKACRVVKIGRNEPCVCGSQKKYKKCCINKEL